MSTAITAVMGLMLMVTTAPDRTPILMIIILTAHLLTQTAMDIIALIILVALIRQTGIPLPTMTPTTLTDTLITI